MTDDYKMPEVPANRRWEIVRGAGEGVLRVELQEQRPSEDWATLQWTAVFTSHNRERNAAKCVQAAEWILKQIREAETDPDGKYNVNGLEGAALGEGLAGTTPEPDDYPNEPAVTFYELQCRGEVEGDDINEFIAFWHTEYPGTLELHEYLGLTVDQYSYWVAHDVVVPPGIAAWWVACREATEERAMREARENRARKRNWWRRLTHS
ncbi:hypothetical protein BH762_gp087 [Gordonia phage OneUp]|uniref:Uncharacterized protein n=1 Tax=Gordonia phage OneUp TaxID=1838074 RepID=A0A160DEZ6_9CAUD|nr:hypothetical protein BH762_gp087 [Gordonia phage OneUp]ANA86432.1 hypothetical protein PBI_ONEUP_98 [Gordonia phage OneUp]